MEIAAINLDGLMCWKLCAKMQVTRSNEDEFHSMEDDRDRTVVDDLASLNVCITSLAIISPFESTNSKDSRSTPILRAVIESEHWEANTNPSECKNTPGGLMLWSDLNWSPAELRKSSEKVSMLNLEVSLENKLLCEGFVSYDLAKNRFDESCNVFDPSNSTSNVRNDRLERSTQSTHRIEQIIVPFVLNIDKQFGEGKVIAFITLLVHHSRMRRVEANSAVVKDVGTLRRVEVDTAVAKDGNLMSIIRASDGRSPSPPLKREKRLYFKAKSAKVFDLHNLAGFMIGDLLLSVAAGNWSATSTASRTLVIYIHTLC